MRDYFDNMIFKIFLVLGTLFNVAAQLLLKHGMKTPDILADKTKFLFNPFLWLAIIIYGLGFLFYAVALTKVELSRAYPFSSILAIILIFLASVLFMNESLTFLKGTGIILSLMGVILIFF